MGLVSNLGTSKYWISRTGIWDSVNSWSDHTIPVSGDNIIFSGQRSKHPVIQGPLPDGGFYNSVTVRPDYSGQWGGPGNFIGFMTDDFLWSGTSDCYFKSGNSVEIGGLGAVETLVINSKPNTGTFYLDTEEATDGEDNAPVGSLIVSSGNLTITDGSINTLHIAPTNYRDSKVMIESRASFSGSIYVSNGFVECYANVGSIYMSGGKWVHESDDTFALYLFGGLFDFNNETTCTYAVVADGILDLTKTDIKKAITVVYRHPSGKVLYVPSRDEVTFIDMLGEEIR
jgi:hypothetical protein